MRQGQATAVTAHQTWTKAFGEFVPHDPETASAADVPMRTRCLRFVLLAAAWLTTHAPAQAEEPLAVDLELVLAVDVSFSMSPEEQRVQRQGYIDALTHPQILAAIAAGPRGRIALAYVEWGGTPYQVVRWSLIDGRDAAERFVAELRDLPHRRIPFTSISRALLHSRALFRENGFEGARRVVDVSGDGPNNDGAPIPLARDTLTAEGIEINGLAIMLPRPRGAPTIPDLDEYYRNCVIGGPRAFVLTVTDTADFAATIRRKLFLEIGYPRLTLDPDLSPPHPSDRPVLLPARHAGRFCLIGEEMQERVVH